MLSALHFLTHIAQGWIVANLVPASCRDRWLIVLGGVAVDLDGVGILWGKSVFEDFHRAVGHSALACLVMIGVVMLIADARWRTAALTAVTFHLHLLLDTVGTGGLPIRYWWPLSDRSWTYDGHWVLASWQNVVVMVLTALGVLVIAGRRRRT